MTEKLEQAPAEAQLQTQETGTASPEQRQPTEGEQVIEILRTFQETLKAMQEKNKAVENQVNLLNDKVNRELPAQLDQAFKDIHDNFLMVTKGLEAINARPQQATGVAAAAAESKEGGSVIEKIFNVILKQVNPDGSPSGPGALSDFDKEMNKEILKTSKQIQLLSLKDMLKKIAKMAGVEISDHITVNP